METNEILKQMIDDCVCDLSINGKYQQMYQMLINSIEENIPVNRLNSMINTLNFVGVRHEKLSKAEILFEYSKLI